MGKRIEKAKDKVNAQDEESGNLTGCIALYQCLSVVLCVSGGKLQCIQYCPSITSFLTNIT